MAERLGFTLESFEEDGLGEARAAGFLTASGRQFSIVEYVNSANRPMTYFLCLYQLETVTNDLREALAAFGLKASDLYGVYDFIDPKGLEDETSSPD
ncbi:MAG: hypothetical protein HOP19_04765 [Acidobacteria bacterium]|nr:hypothetical protein [Acidobacteriota bacterium]